MQIKVDFEKCEGVRDCVKYSTCMTNKNAKVYISRPTINDNKKSATGFEPQNKITKKEDT